MKNRPFRFQSSIEQLESRIAPASFLVTSLADNGSPGTLRYEGEPPNGPPGGDVINFSCSVHGIIFLSHNQTPASVAGPGGPPIVLPASGEIKITDAVTINGPGANRLTIDGGNQSRIFEIDYAGVVPMPTELRGLSLIHGSTPGNGGGLLSNETTFLGGMIISDNHAGGDGGGAYSRTDGQVANRNTAVEGNTAGGSGGGLHIEGDESLLVKGSLIKQNHASGNGGGLVVQLGANAIGDAVINGSEIANNDSGAGGGGLMLIDASPTKQIVVRGSLITGNRALGDGGGVAADSGNPLLMTSFVMLNVAGDAGGGIADRTESFTIINDRIVSNSAANPLGPGGGGLFSDGPHVVNAG